MLLKTMNHAKGLCNGIRLTITKLGTNFIKAEKITGAQVGREVYVSRVKMSMDDLTTTYKIKRRQYPISVCFATITIKSQGWSLSGILPGYSCKEGRIVEDGLLVEFPCTPTRTRSVYSY
jgi:ATP-dependent DNA helicase PIF1